MTGTQPPIADISDTARWVAAYRAAESARPDAVFRDPLADRLAGDRGRAIAAATPKAMLGGPLVVARTTVIDDLIAKSIDEGCRRVLNLGAGFDTRPYRLDLPAELTWVEADLPALLTQKEELLAAEEPRCTLIRHAVDLSDAAAREAFLDEALAGASKALVLTEGLIMYLDDDAVVALAETFVRPEVAWWVVDVPSAANMQALRERADGLLTNAPFVFGTQNGLAFFENLGWTAVECESIFQAAHRLRRLPWSVRLRGYLPGKKRWSVVVRFTR